MSSYFNKIVDKHLSFTDFSLISEVSDINDFSFDGKYSPKTIINKQVRFNSDINVNSFLNSSVISDASLLESESTYYKVPENTVSEFNYKARDDFVKNKSYIKFADGLKQHSYLSNLNYKTNVTDKLPVDELTNVDSKSKESSSKDDDHNDDTSVWSSGTELSMDNINNNEPSSNVKDNLFKTIDEMSSGLSNETSSAVETVISDDISDDGLENTADKPLNRASDLSKPVVNSSRRLKSEIDSLENGLFYSQKNLTQTAKELAVKKLSEQLNMTERFTNINPYAFDSQATTELTQPLNVRPNVELFPELTRISVEDESILISQQKKFAAIRKRAGADKIPKKIEDGLPEPDLMEFFDSNKHIFKSVNLAIGSNLINLKHTLSLSNDRLYSIFRDRNLLNQFQ